MGGRKMAQVVVESLGQERLLKCETVGRGGLGLCCDLSLGGGFWEGGSQCAAGVGHGLEGGAAEKGFVVSGVFACRELQGGGGKRPRRPGRTLGRRPAPSGVHQLALPVDRRREKKKE